MCNDEWIAKQIACLEAYTSYSVDGEPITKDNAIEIVKQNAEYLFGNYPIEVVRNCKFIICNN